METLEIEVEKVIESEKIRELNNQLFRRMYHKNGLEDKQINDNWIQKVGFPGSEAVNLSKRDFEFLKRTNYWDCEKSDGIRALVMILSDGMYLCDRKFSWYFVEKGKLFIPSQNNPKENQNLTIFDCEVTYNYHYEKYCLMIFDILYIEGKKTMDFTLTKRLAVIRDKIIVPFREIYPSQEMQSSLPFILLGKEYLKIQQIKDIFSLIKEFKDINEPSGFRYLYQNKIRYNDNDGLIFTSDEKCYKPKRCISLKRWKWPIFNTVDFLVKVSNFDGEDKCTLFFQNHERLEEYREVAFEKNNLEKLLVDLNGATQAIIECSFNATIGEWIYHRIRNDKSYPNNFSSLMQIMEIISENLSKEDIIRVFSDSIPTTDIQQPEINNISFSKPIENNETEVIYESPLKKHDESPNKNSLVIIGVKRKVDEFYLDDSDILSLEHIDKKARTNSYM